jgi:hypothetical protein
MQSLLDPSVIYADLSRDVVEHDVDVVSDLWTMDDRDVYRGSRDTQYVHANVYWLYSDELERTGLVEHSLTDHADFRILWFHDTPFATFFQEEWTLTESLWSVLPRTTVEKFLSDDCTTPERILSACLQGPSRIITLSHALCPPTVYSCSKCGLKSLRPISCGDTTAPLDFPDKTKIVFVDDELYVCRPPSSSRVWDHLGFRSQKAEPPDAEPALQVQEQRQPEVHSETPAPPPLADPRPPEPSQSESQRQQAHLPTPPAQTSELRSSGPEPTPEHTRSSMSLRSPGPKRRYSG